MVRHAILLASEDWCKAASQGKIKIYGFKKPRKRKIHALKPGSTCVVFTKAAASKTNLACGEFTVTNVREANTEEYNKLARKGLIFDPLKLKPREKVWIIEFDEFREYKYKVSKEELNDVKTAKSKPISEWVITGLSYIDDLALEGIRKKAKGFVEKTIPASIENRIQNIEERLAFIENVLGVSEPNLPITHECTELMLLEIGRNLGFQVYTADPSKNAET